MREVPQISIDRDDIVVDEVHFLRGFLRPHRWRVHWRSVGDPLKRGEAMLTRDLTAGSATLDGEAFSFSIRWRPDLRRRRGDGVLPPETRPAAPARSAPRVVDSPLPEARLNDQIAVMSTRRGR